MSSIGVPVVSRKEKFNPPIAPLDPWEQSDTEKACCLVTLAAQDSSKATGMFCKIGPELVVLVTKMLITSESSASFATAEFYSSGASTPEHHVKLNPKILFENLNGEEEGGMAVIGCPKSGAPKFEVEGGKKGVFVDLPPMELCTDRAQYPGIGKLFSAFLCVS